MVIIDTRQEIAYPLISKLDAARLIGVDPSTIHRWAAAGRLQVYNHYHIYFNCVHLKQNKGEHFRRP